MNRFVAFLFGLTLILISTPVWAQQIEPSKLEIGAQFSSLTLTEPGIKREVPAPKARNVKAWAIGPGETG